MKRIIRVIAFLSLAACLLITLELGGVDLLEIAKGKFECLYNLDSNYNTASDEKKLQDSDEYYKKNANYKEEKEEKLADKYSEDAQGIIKSVGSILHSLNDDKKKVENYIEKQGLGDKVENYLDKQKLDSLLGDDIETYGTAAEEAGKEVLQTVNEKVKKQYTSLFSNLEESLENKSGEEKSKNKK